MKKALITILLIAATGTAARAGEGSLDTLRDYSAKLTAESAAAPAVPAGAAAAQAETPELFKAEMAWYPVKVNALAQLGARKTAEEAAVLKCENQMADGVCVAVGSRVTNVSPVLGSITAAAEARTAVPVLKANFSATLLVPSQRNIYGGFNEVERLGARKLAEEAAVAECRAAGYLACFAVKSVILSCDSFSCEAQAFAKAFQAR
ncbi:MAG: hypothetical protein A2X31_10375 [Elusimicrobia bacterium GWB2_63_22]|nr:MAG: hypothetical protein A2X31_10375 [Elusimicrobia bacterium GWB2_63_22]